MIVYKHTCRTTGKCYIGQSVKTMEARWAEHCSDARYNKKRKFFAALNKYGYEDWDHEILLESDDPAVISDKETEFIIQFDSVNNGYNSTYDRFRTNTTHSPESIEKMRISQRAKHQRKKLEGTDGGWVRKDGGAMLGKSHPGKGKSNANKGKKAGKTWEEIFGIEGAAKRRKAAEQRRLTK